LILPEGAAGRNEGAVLRGDHSLDDYGDKWSARKSPIKRGLALVFIREQCDAESEHRLETSRESCHPMSA